jgi:hypothetical protein
MTAVTARPAGADLPERPSPCDDPLPPFERLAVGLIALGFVALELALSPRYGIHRDELYFIQCAHHLAWGYVDQPPFVPFVAWLEGGVFGVSSTALRLMPALAGGGSVVITALMARELKGGTRAQIIGALAAATSAQLLAMFHLLSTAAFDAFFWSLISWLALRLLRTKEARLWLPLGVVAGIGLLNKLDIAILVAALAAAISLGSSRRLLASRYALGGALLAIGLSSPDLIWNATHSWAQLSMLESLHHENSTLGASLGFIPSQLIVVGPVLAVVWIGGLLVLRKDPAGRPLALTYLLLLAFFTVTGGKSYYLAGAYFALFAAGGVFVEQRVARATRTGRFRRWVVLVVAGALPTLPLALPVLPASALPSGSWEGQINKDLSATLGWQQLAGQVARIAAGLPPAERSQLVIMAGDYGAAGAIDLYGPAYGLPPAISGHNSYWWWGPGDSADHSTTIAVNLSQAYLRTIFTSVVEVGVVATPNNAWTEERGDPIFLCTGQIESWATIWPTARHYD